MPLIPNYNFFVICLPKKHLEVLLNVSVCSRWSWNLEVLVSEERIKPECAAKKLNVEAKNSLIPIYYKIESDVNVGQVTKVSTLSCEPKVK